MMQPSSARGALAVLIAMLVSLHPSGVADAQSGSADLAVSLAASPNPVRAGSTVTYTITVTSTTLASRQER